MFRILLDFLNYIAPILTFLTTLVLAGITFWYALETRKIAEKTKEQVEVYYKQLELYEKQIAMTYSPFVINYGEIKPYELHTFENYSFIFRLLNTGNSCAINIACESIIIFEGKEFNSIRSPRVHKLDSKEITNENIDEFLSFSYIIPTKEIISKNNVDVLIFLFYSSIVSVYYKTTIIGKLFTKKNNDDEYSFTIVPTKYKNEKISELDYLAELNKEGEVSF